MSIYVLTALPSYCKRSGEKGFKEVVKMNTFECEAINITSCKNRCEICPPVTIDLNTALSRTLRLPQRLYTKAT